MTDMIERVARAIYAQMPFIENPYNELGKEKPGWVEKGNSLKQDEARSYAHAAIKAMRDPTKVMLAEIDAALEDKEEKA